VRTYRNRAKIALIAALAAGWLLPGCDDREDVKIPSAKGTGPAKVLKSATGEDNVPMLVVDYLTVQGGNCIVITTPGGKHMMIDGGAPGTEQSIIARLQEVGVQKLDWLIVTCADSAHMGSLPKLAAGMPIGEVYTPGFSSRLVNQLLQATHKKAITASLRAGSSFKMEEGITLEALAPGEDDVMPQNPSQSWLENHSVVLRVRYNKASLLFTGSMGKAEKSWMHEQAVDVHADIVSGLRHGDKEVADVDFVHEITPKIAVLMCDLKNHDGYPHRDALDAMTTTMTKLYRTDVQHGINLRLDGEGRIYVLASRPATDHEMGLAGGDIKRDLEDPKPVKLKNVLSDPDPLGAQNGEENSR
jgi:competence protein ComEC